MTDKTHTLHPAIAANIRAYSRITGKWNREWDKNQNMECRETCRRMFLAALPGPHVLDIGCGVGRDSLFFAVNGCKVTATDIVSDFLPIVRFGNPSITTAIMDMTRPCFKDAAFDGLFLFASFLHVPRELSLPTLAGLRKMLKKGGVLFIHHVKSMQGLESYRVDDLLIPDNPAICFCHDESELDQLLTEAGFGLRTFTHYAVGTKRSATAEKYDLVTYQTLAFNDLDSI